MTRGGRGREGGEVVEREVERGGGERKGIIGEPLMVVAALKWWLGGGDECGEGGAGEGGGGQKGSWQRRWRKWWL